MKDLIYHFNASVRPASLIGLMALVGVVILQTIPNEALAQTSGNRDEFPGRRQGGGTHVVMPLNPE